MYFIHWRQIVIVSSLSFITISRQLDFTAGYGLIFGSWSLLPNMDWYSVVGVYGYGYGLIFGSYEFCCWIWIENPSGCKLDMETQRGIMENVASNTHLRIHIQLATWWVFNPYSAVKTITAEYQSIFGSKLQLPNINPYSAVKSNWRLSDEFMFPAKFLKWILML